MTDRDTERARELLRELNAHGAVCYCAECEDKIAAALEQERREVVRESRLAQIAEALTGEFERTIARAEWEAAGSKGMHVSFHGDFASALRLPSVIHKMRWWAREFRAALTAAEKPVAGKDHDHD